MAEKGRGLSEGRSPEFRSPRQQRVAQGSRRSRPRSLGSPSSLATFFLAKQEESTPALKAENSGQISDNLIESANPDKMKQLNSKHLLEMYQVRSPAFFYNRRLLHYLQEHPSWQQ
jgi:hypothetical protein